MGQTDKADRSEGNSRNNRADRNHGIDRTTTNRARTAIDRGTAGARTRAAMSSPAVGRALNRSAAHLGATPQKTANVAISTTTIGPAAIGKTAEALAARAGLATAATMGTVAAAAALSVIPTNQAPANTVALGQNLRASFPYDSPYGEVQIKTDGTWQSTGLGAIMTPDGIALDKQALQARVGALDDLAPNGATIVDYRRSPVNPALSTYSTRARAAARIGPQPGNWQAHHLIPFEAITTTNPGFQKAVAAAGWRMDTPENVMALPGDRKTFMSLKGELPIHRGPHPKYTNDVRAILRPIEKSYQEKAPEALINEMQDLENRMRYLIENKRYYDTIR